MLSFFYINMSGLFMFIETSHMLPEVMYVLAYYIALPTLEGFKVNDLPQPGEQCFNL